MYNSQTLSQNRLKNLEINLFCLCLLNYVIEITLHDGPLIFIPRYSFLIQIKWGGRYQNGAGMGTGEEMEQAFGYLSRLNSTTKNMTSAGKFIHLIK